MMGSHLLLGQAMINDVEEAMLAHSIPCDCSQLGSSFWCFSLGQIDDSQVGIFYYIGGR